MQKYRKYPFELCTFPLGFIEYWLNCINTHTRTSREDSETSGKDSVSSGKGETSKDTEGATFYRPSVIIVGTHVSPLWVVFQQQVEAKYKYSKIN